MTLATELRQKDVTLTPAMADAIQVRGEKLTRFAPRLQRCTVTVEGPGRHHRQGHYQVRIDLVLPGAELIVRKQSAANLELALKAAFDAAARRLEDRK